MYSILLASAVLVGCLLAVQASANLQLNKAVGTPYGASTLQLGVATGVLFVLAVTAGTIGAVRLVPEVPAWHLLGGLASPVYITSGILLFARLGALTSVGLFVTGQVFASLGLDLFGLLGVARQPLTVGIGLGAVAVLLGITLIIRGQRPAGGPPSSPAPGGGGRAATATRIRATTPVAQAAWIALGVVAGAGLPIQGAVNAQLRADLAAPFTVAMVSFAVATVSIGVVLMVLRGLRATPAPRLRPLTRMPWWGWLGGGCAAAYVTATFLLIPEIGAATTVALTVTGQQLASALIDHYGLFRMPRRALGATRLFGLVLLVTGSALVQLG
jgi:bacterial/archaeal transporter family-2 protein